ncbi:MAG: sigma factor [bacterium]
MARKSDSSAPNEKPTLSPETWLQDHGDILFRYAVARVRNRDVAEDLVQEALLAALKSARARIEATLKSGEL